MNNLFKRILTSIILLVVLLNCLYVGKYLWLLLIIIASTVSFIEFNNLIKKIWFKKKTKIYIINLYSLFYFIFFIYSANFIGTISKEFTLYILLVCIMSDIGGYVVGKKIGGKKLIKISPNKTISGSIGSFIFSLSSVTIIYHENINILVLIILTLFLSFVSQCGDLFISYFKRKAKVKDTGKILPGHGGLLDRIDGIILVVPVSFFLINFIEL
mgnify:CR=1 FL=1